jgi:photosystem II stability/assembly factor-like uncharacterized protein
MDNRKELHGQWPDKVSRLSSPRTEYHSSHGPLSRPLVLLVGGGVMACFCIILAMMLLPALAASASASPSSKGHYNAISNPPWISQSSGTTNTLQSIHFINTTEGWAAGGKTTLLHTTNGGNTWSAVTNTTVDPSRGFNSVHFLDQNVGWVGGTRSIIRTVNSGASWMGVQYTSNEADVIRATFPISSTVVWQVGMQNMCNPCYPVHTRYTFSLDGTIRTSYSHYLASHQFHRVSGVSFIDQDNGWSVGVSVFTSSSIIVRITNGTSDSPNFTVQTSFAKKLRQIQMLDANNGWVIGDGGTIMKTINGGDTWSPQTSGTTADLNGVYFVDLNNGWVVGDGGTILKTTDGGDTWTTEASGTTNDLRGIFFVGLTQGYAVGANGTILTTMTTLYLPIVLQGP